MMKLMSLFEAYENERDEDLGNPFSFPVYKIISFSEVFDLIPISIWLLHLSVQFPLFIIFFIKKKHFKW